MAKLIEAIKQGRKYEDIQRLLSKGIEVNYKLETGDTPLHFCHEYRGEENCATGLKVISALIKNGADVNTKNHSEETPLMKYMDVECNPDFILELLNSNADVNIPGFGGTTALHYYPLYRSNLRPDIFKILLEKHSNINLLNTEKETPLMSFVMGRSNIDYIKDLFDAGADLKCADEDILHFCTGEGLNLLEGKTVVDLNVLELLIDNGADINAHDIYFGWTPLMKFIYDRCPIDHVKVLLNRGVNVNSTDVNGFKALHCFNVHDNDSCLEVLKLVLEYGADVNARDINGCTPFWILIQNFLTGHQYFSYIKTLLNNGASVNCNGDIDKLANYTYLYLYYAQNEVDRINLLFKYSLLRGESYPEKHCLLLKEAKPEYTDVQNDMECFSNELIKSKTYVMKDLLTLFNFLQECNYKKLGQYFRNCDTDLVDLKKTFPHYFELIELKMEVADRWCNILNTVEGLTFSSTSLSSNKEVELNADCFLYITHFLAPYDLLKLTWAAGYSF